jgi:hypothetical protein
MESQTFDQRMSREPDLKSKGEGQSVFASANPLGGEMARARGRPGAVIGKLR